MEFKKKVVLVLNQAEMDTLKNAQLICKKMDNETCVGGCEICPKNATCEGDNSVCIFIQANIALDEIINMAMVE